MFIDWLSISQEHPHDLPNLGGKKFLTIDEATGDVISSKRPKHKHRESFSTSIDIHISGRRIRVDGNPSRVGRLDNLFGFSTIEQCVVVFNKILSQYGLPPFTKCTEVLLRDGVSGAKAGDLVADGAVIHRIDLTTNISVGKGNVRPYLRAVSSQRIGHSIGFLYPNGRTVVWTPDGGGSGGRLQYRKAYDKAAELIKLLRRIKRQFGEDSDEYRYVVKVREYCLSEGIVRMEQELKSEYLKREGLAYWGLFKEARFIDIHNQFLALDENLQVTALDIMTIADQLIEGGYCKSRQAANATAACAHQWMAGHELDFKKSQTKIYAARLKHIGIFIRNSSDTTRFSPVVVRESREIVKSSVVIPSWYRRPNHLQIAA